MDNVHLIGDFLATAKRVSDNLKEKYADGWNAPDFESPQGTDLTE